LSDSSTAGSVSRLAYRAQVRGRGEAKVSIYRHLAPLTVNALVREMPLNSRVNVQPAMVCLFTPVKIGVEKPRSRFERGDVAFMASSGLLCFFLKSAISDRPLNPVGKVESGLETFDSIRPGDVVLISAESV
jgi:hypothetical protein